MPIESEDKAPKKVVQHLFSLRGFFRGRVVEPLIEQLKKGVPVRRLAHSMAMGVVAAIYPQLGCTTLMGLLLGYLFRLNHATIQVVKFILYPLQFVFMIPFLRLGETLLGIEHFRMSLKEIVRIVYDDPLGSFKILGWPLVHAIFGWIVACSILYYVFYSIGRTIAKQLQRSLRYAEKTRALDMNPLGEDKQCPDSGDK